MLKYGNRNQTALKNIFQEPRFTLGTVYHDYILKKKTEFLQIICALADIIIK